MIRLVALGDAVIHTPAGKLTPLAAKKFALVLRLVAAQGAVVTRAALNELLFGELDEKKALHSLRELVYQLRQMGTEINGNAHGLSIDLPSVQCDWLEASLQSRFDARVLAAMQRGFLPGYAPDLSLAYRQWLDAFRARASLDLVKLCLREIDVAKTGGDWTKAEQAARACLAIDPLNGHATIALAEVLAIVGSASQAAAVLDAFANEIGAEARKFTVPLQMLRRKIAEGPNAGLSRSTFRFAGRREEMTLLTHSLAEAKQVGARGVLLVGEAGIGKSRIAGEFARKADLEGCVVVRFNAHPYDRDRPMGAFIDIVPTLLEQPGALGCAPESMDWLNVLVGRKSEATAKLPTSSSADTANAVSRAVIDVVAAIANEAPIVLVFDDAQWIDRTSLQLMRDAVRASAESRVLIIVTARDELSLFLDGTWGECFVFRKVSPLDREVTRLLVSHELSAVDVDLSLIEWMVDVANGNPFFVDSLVAHFLATGERFAIPPQLSSIVDQRILTLSAEGRDVLEAIVALGKHATIDRLETVLQHYGTALISHARELGNARLITGEQELISSHWLIVESVQRNATPLSQRLLHRRIAAMLEREVRRDGDSSELWECAQAWVVAGDSDHAASLVAACAEHALSIGRAREASDLYFRAAGMADATRTETFAEASIRAGVSAMDADAVLRGVPLLRSRVKVRIHDDIELAESRATIWSDRSIESKLGALRECFECADATREHRLTAAMSFVSACADSGLMPVAIDASASIAALLEREAIQRDALWAQAAAVFHTYLGDPSQVQYVVQPIIALAEESRPDSAATLLRIAATSLRQAGERIQAIALWTRAQDVAQRAGLSRLIAGFRLALASQHLDLDQVESGRSWFRQVELPAGSETEAAWQALHWAYLSVAAEFALYDGDRIAALGICQRASCLPIDRMGSRSNRYRAALSALHGHLRGQDSDLTQLVASLTANQLPGYELGVLGDFEMAVLLMILQDMDQRELAAAELHQYIATRRKHVVPLSAMLIRVAGDLLRSDGVQKPRSAKPSKPPADS